MKTKEIIIAILIGIFSCSCSDWLDVNSNTDKEASDFLKTENGYKGALTGVYLKMKGKDAYGKQLSMGFVEYLAQHWTPRTNNLAEIDLMNFRYDNTDVERMITDIYGSLFQIISESNMILDNIDANYDVFNDPRTFDLIKGEALGLRAMCHFDVLRLWGPIPGRKTNGKILPYVSTFGKDKVDYISFDLFVKNLLDDLDKAEKLLEPIDPLLKNNFNMAYDNVYSEGMVDHFWIHRQMRMNYFAVCALKARVYLWANDKENALFYARKVIDVFTGNLATVPDFETADKTLFYEHILALDVYNLGDKYKDYFLSTNKENLQKDKGQIQGYFYVADARLNLWEDATVQQFTFYTISKYKQSSNESVRYKNKIPLIRISEMYLIAVECGDPESQELLNNYLFSRGLSARDIEAEDIKSIMLEQYNKEFYAEGQMFYTYKRLESTRMEWGKVEMENEENVYVIPLPMREREYNN